MNTKPDGYDVTKYERPSVTVDVLLFTIISGSLQLLLIKRDEEPYKNSWALPGGFVRMTESVEDAAYRELEEEAGLKGMYLEQLYTFGELDRDPRTRVISVAYMALSENKDWSLASSGDAADARFFAVSELPNLAFDHKKIINYGLTRLRNKLEYTDVAFELLPKAFTLTQLQRVYETILGKTIDKRNFRKKMLSGELLTPSKKMSSGDAHRPALLYSFRKVKHLL